MVSKTRKDITTRDDVKLLVDRFYEKVNQDELLAPVFSHVDWPNHLPIMYDFWASIVLGEMSYNGNPFAKHIHLNINKEHFTRWLELFTKTVDVHFEGYNATQVKTRALSIADLFQYKRGLLGNRS
ncbi:MAG: group III truncated hemoglobin [Cyclobacteriaceae bacterium]|nr:group III truncated hemoglobin [Cyclobacteriaceae bacterium]